MIRFKVEDKNGSVNTIEVPEEISLSLMEVLKASDYPVLATCGGMALCATCHVDVKDGIDRVGPPNEVELDMIDTLPNARSSSRLACQIRISDKLNDALFALME